VFLKCAAVKLGEWERDGRIAAVLNATYSSGRGTEGTKRTLVESLSVSQFEYTPR